MTRPRVVVHVAVSVDAATTGFAPDLGRFYGLLPTWNEEVTLVGSDTILAQEAALAAAPMPGPTADAPLLAVVDSRHRVTQWTALRDCGHWSGVLAVRAVADEHDGEVPTLIAGADREGRVNLTAALEALADEYGANTVRVDSGGSLTGALLAAGLVDELSLLVHPVVAGPAGDHHWWGPGTPPQLDLREIGAAADSTEGLTWLRYEIAT
jgi:2,5-diamino-6-(ribosylamino)-4(3H)-pyrimidinone 5'-phosphate reductase